MSASPPDRDATTSQSRAVCHDCRHSKRGSAVDMRVRNNGSPPPPSRPGLQGGEYICDAKGKCRQRVRDPVTGRGRLPLGPDCRDLNPSGECEDFDPSRWRRLTAALWIVT